MNNTKDSGTDPIAWNVSEVASDLSEEAVAAVFGDRPVRTFVAVVSSEAEAMRWARGSAEGEVPEGAVIVGRHQIGLRNRNGIPWPVEPEHGLAFSVILKPRVAPIRSGRLYLAGVAALLEVMPGDVMAEWPDAVHDGDRELAGVVTRLSTSVRGVDWCVLTFYVVSTTGDRAQLAAAIVRAFDEHWGQPDAALLGFFKEHCRTLGRRIRATFLPLGPKSRRVEGEAVDVTAGGGLVTVVDGEKKVTLQIADIGRLEYLSDTGTTESEDAIGSPLDFWPLAGDVVPPSGEGWTP